MATKEQIRPIYAEFQAYYSQVGCIQGDYIWEPSVWKHYNERVDTLGRLLEEDYGHFKVEVKPRETSDEGYGIETTTPERVSALSYRMALAGLIKTLHATYFADENDPTATGPSTIISQIQTQSQFVHIQMIMEVNEQLTRSEANFKEGSKERGFIDKVKDHLKSGIGGVTSVAQLILLILNIADQCGLSVADMHKIFGG